MRHVGVVHKFFKEHFEEAVRRHNDETKLTTRPSVGAKRNLSVVKIQSFLSLGPLPKLQLTVGDAELHHSDPVISVINGDNQIFKAKIIGWDSKGRIQHFFSLES